MNMPIDKKYKKNQFLLPPFYLYQAPGWQLPLVEARQPADVGHDQRDRLGEHGVRDVRLRQGEEENDGEVLNLLLLKKSDAREP